MPGEDGRIGGGNSCTSIPAKRVSFSQVGGLRRGRDRTESEGCTFRVNELMKLCFGNLFSREGELEPSAKNPKKLSSFYQTAPLQSKTATVSHFIGGGGELWRGLSLDLVLKSRRS